MINALAPSCRETGCPNFPKLCEFANACEAIEDRVQISPDLMLREQGKVACRGVKRQITRIATGETESFVCLAEDPRLPEISIVKSIGANTNDGVVAAPAEILNPPTVELVGMDQNGGGRFIYGRHLLNNQVDSQ